MIAALSVADCPARRVEPPHSKASTQATVPSDKVMEPKQRRPLPEGDWGGDGIRLVIGANSASVELACSNGEIPGKIYTDKEGSFAIDGTFKKQHPGPTRRDEPPPADARYAGKVSGDKMSLRITLASDGSLVGEYILEKGRNSRIVRCL
jgi:hypothetical protein